jgi:hypothetical protein
MRHGSPWICIDLAASAAWVFAALFGTALLEPAFAEGDCFSAIDLASDAPPRLAKVVASYPRVYLLKSRSEAKDCPADVPDCRSRAYVVSGDELFTGARLGDFICASFVSAKGLESAGWVAVQALAPQPAPAAAMRRDDWIGRWTGGPEQSIDISRGPGSEGLKISGSATYGALDRDRIKRGAVNSGEISAEIAASAATLAFTMADSGTKSYAEADQYECRVRMRRFAAYLLVEDNRNCGGNNVSFTGTYRRK